MHERRRVAAGVTERESKPKCDPELKCPSLCRLIGTLFGLCHGDTPVPVMLFMSSLPSRYPFHDVLAACPLRGTGNQDLKVTKGTHPAVTAA